MIRVAAQCAVMEQGRAHVPVDKPFMPVSRSELPQFPNAKHDDQVDSVSRFLERATERRPTAPTLVVGAYSK